MNMEVIYTQNPTSLAYSTNKKTVALFPICVEYINTHGQLCKGAIAFLSEDKTHDHQQVEQFEIRAFHIIRELLKRPINNWKRFSDGCAGQVAARMFDMKWELELDNLSYDLFEANKGKNTSDTIGSIVKCAFLRGIYQQDEGLTSIEDMIGLIKSHLKSSMEKFQLFIVESFGRTERTTKRKELVIPEITKVHSIVMHGDTLIPKYRTCLACRIDKVCEECAKSFSVPKENITTKESKENDDAAVYSVIDKERFYDSKDEGFTDQSDSDESESDDEEDVGPGDIVWALYGRTWYPACLCNLIDLPEGTRRNFKNPKGKFIAKWYGEERYSLVSKVDHLAENRLDAQRASRSKDILQAYNLALEELNN